MFANIPDGGGWRYVGRVQGRRNAEATARRTGQRGNDSRPAIGTAYLHTVIDDHSRVAYVEICSDEKAATAIGVLQRAVAWYAQRGVSVQRVLSDNGSAYKSHAWRDACEQLGITHERTRPYRPQTNGKIERFHRTLEEGRLVRCIEGSRESAHGAAQIDPAGDRGEAGHRGAVQDGVAERKDKL